MIGAPNDSDMNTVTLIMQPYKFTASIYFWYITNLIILNNMLIHDKAKSKE